jgi:hypothetical protein
MVGKQAMRVDPGHLVAAAVVGVPMMPKSGLRKSVETTRERTAAFWASSEVVSGLNFV